MIARPFQKSISARLTWMNLLVTGAALLLACVAFGTFDTLVFRGTIVRALTAQAEIVGTNSVSALVFNDARAAESTLGSLRATPSVVFAEIAKADGTAFARYQRVQGRPQPVLPSLPPEEQQAYWFADQKLVVARKISLGGTAIGTVYIQRELSDLRGRLWRYGVIAALVMSLCLVAAYFLSAFFRSSLARPIVTLAETARTVSRERNYSLRARDTEAEGELATLVQCFNEMLTQIQARDEALRLAHLELEQRVEERTTQLTAANKELEAFSYSVSHDLRAPLRSIDGFSQALLEDCGEQLDKANRAHLDRVRAATQRMSLLIDDLLNLSRVARAPMHKEQLDLSGMADGIAGRLLADEPSRAVEFVIEKGLRGEGDSRLMQLVLENLLGNAWKYTSAHARAKIEFGARRSDGRMVYFVRDDGAGFDPRYAERLFGAFQRLHGMSEFPGTGVGLATVQRIIHRHGGEVWAEAEVEKGATFYFSL